MEENKRQELEKIKDMKGVKEKNEDARKKETDIGKEIKQKERKGKE